MGLALEDRVMFVDVPIFLDIEPAITANIASISLFGIDIISVCVLPIDLNKDKDEDKDKDESPPSDPCDGDSLIPEQYAQFAALADKPQNAPSKLLAYYFTRTCDAWAPSLHTLSHVVPRATTNLHAQPCPSPPCTCMHPLHATTLPHPTPRIHRQAASLWSRWTMSLVRAFSALAGRQR